MSNPHSHGGSAHGGGGPENLHDMSLGKIVIVGVVSLAIFAAGVLWAYQILNSKRRELDALGTASDPTHIHQQEIGIVDQVPFDIDRRLEKSKAHDAKLLSEYGWVDRAKGIARIPIDKAMQQVVMAPPDIAGEGVPPAARPVLPAPSMAPPVAGGRAVPRKAGEGGKP